MIRSPHLVLRSCIRCCAAVRLLLTSRALQEQVEGEQLSIAATPRFCLPCRSLSAWLQVRVLHAALVQGLGRADVSVARRFRAWRVREPLQGCHYACTICRVALACKSANCRTCHGACGSHCAASGTTPEHSRALWRREAVVQLISPRRYHPARVPPYRAPGVSLSCLPLRARLLGRSAAPRPATRAGHSLCTRLSSAQSLRTLEALQLSPAAAGPGQPRAAMTQTRAFSNRTLEGARALRACHSAALALRSPTCE